MATTVGIRFNNIEEERLFGAMLAAGDENISTHVKRVYFAALDRLDHYDQLKSELDLVRHELRELREQQVHAAENTDSSSTSLVEAITQQLDLLLTLESGIYRMLRQAVPYAIQRDADKVINIDAIEEYLKPDPPDDDHATTTDAVSKDTTNSEQSRPEQSSSGRVRTLNPCALGKQSVMRNKTQEMESTAYVDKGQLGKSGAGSTTISNPYLEGKLQAQAERARRAAESKSEVQKILYPDVDEASTAKQAKIAMPVNQKPTFAQKLKQSFTR